MSELRLDQYVMPAANLGPASPLVPLWYDTAELAVPRKPVGLDEEDVKYFGYGYHHGCLPYFVQDDYDRARTPRAFKAAVLENENLRATFLLELGGRLWSLFDKRTKRELLHVNPVFQPANLGLRNAWISGGVEWNFCWMGHTPFTCRPAVRRAGRNSTTARPCCGCGNTSGSARWPSRSMPGCPTARRCCSSGSAWPTSTIAPCRSTGGATWPCPSERTSA